MVKQLKSRCVWYRPNCEFGQKRGYCIPEGLEEVAAPEDVEQMSILPTTSPAPVCLNGENIAKDVRGPIPARQQFKAKFLEPDTLRRFLNVL